MMPAAFGKAYKTSQIIKSSSQRANTIISLPEQFKEIMLQNLQHGHINEALTHPEHATPPPAFSVMVIMRCNLEQNVT